MYDAMLDFADKLLDILGEIYALRDYENRTMLLRHLPPEQVGFLSRHRAMLSDLNNIVHFAESLKQLSSGEWALVIVARNALRFARKTPQEHALESLLASLEIGPRVVEVPTVKEMVIGRDERLPIHFLERALAACRAVARVLVPRIVDGTASGRFVYGTGWLASPDLLITNHHVIAAREVGEAPVTEFDLRSQAEQAVAWFDYHERDKPHIEYRCTQLVSYNPDLDYAVLRLHNDPSDGARVPISDWGYVSIRRASLSLTSGDRLNIVQHPQGGPKRLAIRSNFYLNPSTRIPPNRLRYLTDTEPGSSGSPIFDDDWQVVGLHEAFVQVPTTQYNGSVIKYSNQGVIIQAVLEDLSHDVYVEIARHQHWPD